MGKLLGSLLLCAGGGLACLGHITANRKKVQILRELAAALESIETAIRWQKLPLPRAIRQQSERLLCGASFERIQQAVKGGTPLHISWEKEFQANYSAEIAEILCRVEWNGDEEQLTGNLHHTAMLLQSLAQEKAVRQAETERLSIALSASAVGLLVIILL